MVLGGGGGVLFPAFGKREELLRKKLLGDVSFAVAFLGRSRRKEKKKKGMETGEQGYLFIMLRFPESAKYMQNNFVKNKEKKRKTKGMLLWKIDSVV